MSGNNLDGLGIFATNSALMNANVQNGQFQGNGRDAFHVEALAGSTVNLFVDPTNASNSGRDGLFYFLGQDSVLNTRFLNSNLNNSNGSAVYGFLANLATVNLFFDQTTGQNSGGDGFYLNALNGSWRTSKVDHGSFANSGTLVGGSSAINVLSDNSTVNMVFNQVLGNNVMPNSMPGNQAYGLSLTAANNSVFNGAIENVNFSGTVLDAFNVNVTSGSNAQLTVFNT